MLGVCNCICASARVSAVSDFHISPNPVFVSGPRMYVIVPD